MERLPLELVSFILDRANVDLRELARIATVSKLFQAGCRYVSTLTISLGCLTCAVEKQSLLDCTGVRRLIVTARKSSGSNQMHHLELDLQGIEVLSLTISRWFRVSIIQGASLRNLSCSADSQLEAPVTCPRIVVPCCKLLRLTEARLENLSWEETENVLEAGPRLRNLGIFGMGSDVPNGGLPRLDVVLQRLATSNKDIQRLETGPKVLEAPVQLRAVHKNNLSSLLSVSISGGLLPLNAPGQAGLAAYAALSQVCFLLENAQQLEVLDTEFQVAAKETSVEDYETLLKGFVRLQRIFTMTEVKARVELKY